MSSPVGPRAYLAGPEVFLPNAAQIGLAKRRICDDHGLIGVFPGDGDFDRRLAGLASQHAGLAAFDICVEMMDGCDLSIANMTPFRGPSMDLGTAIEMGYLHGQGKPVFGYTNTAVPYSQRVTPDECLIEPFDLCDNLMAPGVVHRSTGLLPHLPPDGAGTGEIDALDAFAACVRAAAAFMTDRSESR